MKPFKMPREERLAEELHRQYRAAEKSVTRVKEIYRKGKKIKNPNLLLHDHGWSACGQRKYFRKRAKLMLARANGEKLNDTLGGVEEQFNARLLIMGYE